MPEMPAFYQKYTTMIGSVLMNPTIASYFYRFFVYAIAMLTALPFHEFAHAWTANKLGDSTARFQGRLSLNPLRHLDPIGSLMMIVFGFGWAKPVPINPYNFRKPKRDMAISSLAGPVSNLLLGLVCMLIYKILTIASWYVSGFGAEILANLTNIFRIMISLNIGLAVFNLLPIPPLDGSRILGIVLPERTYFELMKYERFIMLALMAAIWFDVLDRPIAFITGYVYQGMNFLTGFIDLFAGWLLR
jgi:Zn-dependent protease